MAADGPAGSYLEGQQAASGGINDVAAAVASQIAAARSAAASRQADAARFIMENGHAVVNGHAAVDSVPGSFTG